MDLPASPLPHPLAGLRVLDFSRVVAGPFAGRLLSDLGADVVKVEPPEGDLTRVWGEQRAGISGFFTQQNAGKRNVCVDLKREGAADLVRDLAVHADLVIENYRPGVMARLGLAYETLRAANPRVVMLSISGFGQTGPDRDRAAYAPVIHAESGLLARQAEFDGRSMTDLLMSPADSIAGLHGLVAALSALLLRERTGEGQHIDIAMLDALIATDDYTHHAVDAFPVRRLGGEIWEVPGGPILLAGEFRNTWIQARKAGVADPAPPGADLPTKEVHRRRAVAEWLLSFPDREACKAALDSLSIAWGEPRHAEAAVRSPHAVARGVVATVDGRDGDARGVVQSPYRFSAAASGVRGPAAHRGEHNAEVLGEWLGMAPAEVVALEAAGVLVTDDQVRVRAAGG